MEEAGLAAAREASDARLPRYSVVRAIIAAAIAARDAVGRDTARLDWLEAQAANGYGWHARRSVTNRGYRLHQHTRGGMPTAREAIDAAMSAPPAQEPAA